MTEAAWEIWLREEYPAYLLPASLRAAIPLDVARRFLDRMGHQPEVLRRLKVAAFLASHQTEIESFARVLLPRLAAALPSTSVERTRRWRGAFQGRLAVPPTHAAHLAGDPTVFVTTTRTRSFDLPENRLLRAVASRLSGLVDEARVARLLPTAGWGAGVRDAAVALDHTCARTALRQVPLVRATPIELVAAHSAKHPAYRLALLLHEALRQLDGDDPTLNSALLARGALTAMEPSTRFELAVVVRLVQALETRLSPTAGWTLELSAVMAGRDDVARFVRADGTRVDVVYNQAVLESRARDPGAKHYLGAGRLRPDATVRVVVGDVLVRACVLEAKHTPNPSYIATGFSEATLYRWEYDSVLTGWPKAILVTDGAVPGATTREHDVAAVTWSDWVPDLLLDGLVEGL